MTFFKYSVGDILDPKPIGGGFGKNNTELRFRIKSRWKYDLKEKYRLEVVSTTHKSDLELNDTITQTKSELQKKYKVRQ